MLRVLLSVASLALLATAQSDERVIAVRSLLPFMAASLQSDAAISSALPDADLDAARDTTLPGRDPGNTNWLLALLTNRHMDALRSDDLSLTPQANTRIVIAGTKGAVNACLADIDCIAATLTRSIEISAYEINVPNGELPPAFIDGQSLQATIAAAPPRWSARAVTRSGGSVQLGDARWTAYVGDQDAEVAKKTEILDPKVDQLFQGKRLTLTVHALPNDELLLRGAWLTSERIAIEEADIGLKRAKVHLPFNRTANINFGGRIQNGTGLVVAGRRTDEHGMEFVFLVRAR